MSFIKYSFKMLKNEFWWGGTSADGEKSPFDINSMVSHDFTVDSPNQTMPMFLSNFGRCIWSETPFKVKIKSGEINIDGDIVTLESFGKTLKDAYRGAMNKYFPPSGKLLPDDFFKLPQYNTWMQLTYEQTQKGVMEYAYSIIENGFKPGILMIDEGWQKDYGIWEFDNFKFPKPKKMIDELHQMGFKVMLWVVPYVRPDGKFFIKHTQKELSHNLEDDYFLRTNKNDIAIVKWWNGFSASFDLTKECDRNLFDNQLTALMENFGIDGFKFDGGTIESYSNAMLVNKGKMDNKYTPAERNIAWNDFGAKYKFHEFKDTFKGGGKRVIQRISDRNHAWEGWGINSLIPNAILQGLLGHPFICPDMIGGGDWSYRELQKPVDQELFVRMAQCSALFPMMQFSWSPWEAVDSEHLKLIKYAHDKHIAFSDTILRLVDDAYKTGEPILRNLEYNFPHCGFAEITDIFMLGEEYLVAPIINKGQTTKEVPLPNGKWLGFDNKEYIGGKTIKISVTMSDIPYFKRI